MAKFNKLDVPHQWKDEFTKYPHGYTIFEALCKWTKQVDEMVDNVNDWNDYLDNFVENFEFELQEEVQLTIERWQSEGLLDDIIGSALNTELDNVKTQLAQTEQVVKDKLSLEQFKHLVEITNGVEDWTEAFKEGIAVTSLENNILVLPNMPIHVSTIHFEEMSNIHIEFLESSLLTAIPDLESHFLVFRKCTNITIKDYRADGKNHYTRGLMFLEGNKNVKINEITVKNISPFIKENPTFINSVGVFIASHDNHNFDIGTINVDGVRNNNNDIIGDSLGSSRGVLFDTVNEIQTVACTNIRVDTINIKNVFSEDGDGIQFNSKPVKHDIIINNVFTDNTQRRSLKYQGIKGVRIKNLVAKQTDRSFTMVAVVSLLTTGNIIDNYEIDCRAVKGIEFSPSSQDGHETLLGNGSVTLTNEELINGSTTYPLDIIGREGVAIKNLTVDDFTSKAANEGVIIRGWTRNVKIHKLTHESYTGNKIGVKIVKNTDISPDGVEIDHVNLVINNVIAERSGVYPESGVTMHQVSFMNHFSKNGLNPYGLLSYHKGIRVSPYEYISNTMPTSGDYRKGDYVRNTLPERVWNNDIPAWELIKGWYRLTDGEDHVVGADWVVDRIIIETQ